MVRRLYWFPIIHAPEDLGSLREQVSRLYVQEIGKTRWDEHRRNVDAVWKAIRDQIHALQLDFARVKLYQDGLPVCGHEEKIVRELAETGSPNHKLLLDLIASGASLVGTESPELLVREYALARQLLEAAGTRVARRGSQRLQALGREILRERDAFIALRIADSLSAGETGILFLGMLHSLDGLLPPDLALERVNLSLPARETAG